MAISSLRRFEAGPFHGMSLCLYKLSGKVEMIDRARRLGHRRFPPAIPQSFKLRAQVRLNLGYLSTFCAQEIFSAPRGHDSTVASSLAAAAKADPSGSS